MAKWYILWPNGIFYGQMVYFMAKWYILWPNGIFYVQMVYFIAKWYILWPPIWYMYILYSFCIFFPFWYVVPGKIWQPCVNIVEIVEASM
jgi:hypothetical protein